MKTIEHEPKGEIAKEEPVVVLSGKRTPKQLEIEGNFAVGISSGAYDRLAEYVRSLKREGKLVDCSI
jgi:hypothetical protein